MTNKTLAERIYVDVIVQCDKVGCAEMFVPEAEKVGNRESSACVDAWAVSVAEDAENLGWRGSGDNEILCPLHANQATLLK